MAFRRTHRCGSPSLSPSLSLSLTLHPSLPLSVELCASWFGGSNGDDAPAPQAELKPALGEGTNVSSSAPSDGDPPPLNQDRGDTKTIASSSLPIDVPSLPLAVEQHKAEDGAHSISDLSSLPLMTDRLTQQQPAEARAAAHLIVHCLLPALVMVGPRHTSFTAP